MAKPTRKTFRVRGLDCAEEVRILRAALAPHIADPEALSFDLLNGRMSVDLDGTALAPDDVVRAVAAAGMEARPYDPAAPTEEAGLWRRWGREALCGSSGLFALAGFAIHALQGGAAAAFSGGETGHGYPAATVVCYVLSIAGGAWFFAPKGWLALRHLRPDINLLVTIAIAGAALLGNWFEAAMVAFLFALALLLESWSIGHARRTIGALMDLTPATARFLAPGCCSGECAEVQERPVAEVPVGATVLVRPGERIPLDGAVTRGTTSVNEAPLTGESAPVEKAEGAKVFAGTLNNEGAFEFTATQGAGDTTLARIVRMVEEAQSRRAPSEQWVDQFARYYTPAMMLVAVAVAVGPPLAGAGAWSAWFYNALVVLLIACPCALVISTPVSIVAGLARAAREGVLVKGGVHLETPARLRAIALDKTGTLTFGDPSVQEVVALNGHAPSELLAMAAAAESMSRHPLAQAVVRHAADAGLRLPTADAYEAVPGKGARASVAGQTLWIGSERFLQEQGLNMPEGSDVLARLEDAGHSVILMGLEDHGHVCGVISLATGLRPESRAIVDALKRAGIRHVAMLTGDNDGTARAIAQETGVDAYRAQLLPGEKVRAVEDLVREHGCVAMVGDGVNDAPAMASCQLGIVMGAAGQDAAIEAADVALMADDLSRLPWLVEHSRRVLRIIKQNVAVALGFKLAFIVLAIAGKATLWLAIVADMGASLLVIFNALRLLRSGGGPAGTPGPVA